MLPTFLNNGGIVVDILEGPKDKSIPKIIIREFT